MKLLHSTPTIKEQTKAEMGFTLVELLVGLIISGILAGLAFTVTFHNRNLYVRDNARINTNQNLRAAMDLLGLDIRQAGEYITDRSFPTILLQDDPAGDVLVLRRGLDETSLPVCSDVSGSTTSIAIALPATPIEECGRIARDDDPAQIWPDNIYAWQTYRTTFPSSQVFAFIFDEDNSPDDGEFFLYNDETRVPASTPVDPNTPSTYSVTRTPGTFSNTYSVAGSDVPSLTLLEERRFYLDTSGNLVLETIDSNGQTGAQLVVGSITDFQVTVTLQDGTILTTFNPGDDWSEVASVDVTISGETFFSSTGSISQTLSSSFLPRNILSFREAP